MIDPSKKYRTRDGRDPKHLHRAPEGWPDEYPWRGMIGGKIVTWADDGRYSQRGCNRDLDLVEVREPLEVTWIVNRHNTVFHSQEAATTWDRSYPDNAPHRVAKFREVIEETNPTP